MIETMSIPRFPSNQVRPLRVRLALKQAELAEKIGVTRELVSMWERGERIPTGPAAILLAHEAARAELDHHEKNFQKIPNPA
jgi:DNA-binding transcriptional regulator YiaG